MTERTPEQIAKDIRLSWMDIQKLSEELAAKLQATGKSWQKIAAVTRAGMIPSCLVAYDLDIRHIETISVESYNKDEYTHKLTIHTMPTDAGTGAGMLVIDEICDTGNTFRAIRETLPDATYACLIVKPDGAPLADISVKTVDQTVWVHFPWESREK